MSWLEFFVAIFAIACAKESIVAVARAIGQRKALPPGLPMCSLCGRPIIECRADRCVRNATDAEGNVLT